jgi:hypothetical protein
VPGAQGHRREGPACGLVRARRGVPRVRSAGAYGYGGGHWAVPAARQEAVDRCADVRSRRWPLCWASCVSAAGTQGPTGHHWGTAVGRVSGVGLGGVGPGRGRSPGPGDRGLGGMRETRGASQPGFYSGAVETDARDRLALVLTAPGEPLEVREAAAIGLAAVGDRRAFETLALLLNYRDEARASRAAAALSRLGDPRTGRAAAALATTAIRLLAELRAPEAVPALTATLERLLAASPAPHERIALACVEGLGELCAAQLPPAARRVLRAATAHPPLAPAAHAALARSLSGGPRTASSVPAPPTRRAADVPT